MYTQDGNTPKTSPQKSCQMKNTTHNKLNSCSLLVSSPGNRTHRSTINHTKPPHDAPHRIAHLFLSEPPEEVIVIFIFISIFTARRKLFSFSFGIVVAVALAAAACVAAPVAAPLARAARQRRERDVAHVEELRPAVQQ